MESPLTFGVLMFFQHRASSSIFHEIDPIQYSEILIEIKLKWITLIVRSTITSFL